MKYKSLFDIWKQSCEKYGDLIAFSDNVGSLKITYKQAFREVCFLSAKLKEYGIEKDDHIAYFCVNNPRWLIIEEAFMLLGGVSVAKSSEIDEKELYYVYKNSDSSVLITDKIEIIEEFIKLDPCFIDRVKFIIYTGSVKSKILENRKIYSLLKILGELTQYTELNVDFYDNPENIAYLSYTSGTSSSPKGAMLPNQGMAYVVEQLQLFNDIEPKKKFVVTFPLSSAGGKSFNLLCFSQGCEIIYTQYNDFYNVISTFKPDYLHCAPKILQTIYQKLMDEVSCKYFFLIAYKLSKLLLTIERKYINLGKFSFLHSFYFKIKTFIDKNYWKKFRNTLLKDETTIFVGSAHLSKPLEDFFSIIGISLIQHYGLTETTGLAVSNTLKSQKTKPYTVGKAFEGTVIKIVEPETFKELPANEIGLITLGGIEIMKGYYKNPEATEKSLLKNGFLNTYDLGYVDNDGYLVVLSRYDNVIVMSNGYNVYAPLLENEAKDCQFLNQIVIVGHGKPYLIALIVLNNIQYERWCSINRVLDIEPNKNKLFQEFLIKELNEKIKRKNEYRYYEKVKKVYFLDEEFSVENGLLTGTLKVKSKKVCEKYKKEIDLMYERI